jgi:hypothetical protein
MHRISLAAIAITALLIGLTHSVPTGAIPAKSPVAELEKTSLEPSELQMRAAFEGFLSALVSGTLALVAETGGPEAVRAVREKGNDRFEIRSFRKLDCTPSREMADYVCNFAVGIAVTGAVIERSMTGRFSAGSAGVVFAESR